ncbi:MAG: phenylalanine--tRNA ligase subunit beta [Candidatus Babeliales bacterium]
MKLSLAWIFDHIAANWRTLDMQQLVAAFNSTTAEIESWHKIAFPVNFFSLAQVTAINNDYITLYSPEHNTEFQLPSREQVAHKQWYLIRIDDTCSWATIRDMGGEKEGMLPILQVQEPLRTGAWKKQIELYDYVLEIDNKSVTHRPDLWGHRGFAREIAAILGKELKPLTTFLQEKKIKSFSQQASVSDLTPFSIDIKDLSVCQRFAGLYLPAVEYNASSLWMALRLSRTNNRPINAIVDSANYVMLDLSQPMHTYDATKIKNKSIIVRYAQPKEKLTVLDGQKLILTENDLVIADNEKAIGLAGIMGGENTAVVKQTKAIFLESACFDPVTIRWTTLRYKMRTEASSRFEKGLDPNQNISAIMRFLQLLDDAHISYTTDGLITSVGSSTKPGHIQVTLSFINKRLGTTMAAEKVVNILQSLMFIIERQEQKDDILFVITVPTFRAKDVTIKEDIVEEIGRFFGYDAIQFVLPTRILQPTNLQAPIRLRKIKQLLSFGLSMREIQNYSFFDESFLRKINWEPTKTVSVTDPVSENFKRLVTSLVPHLFQAVAENNVQYKQLRFFEWARIWTKEKDDINECKTLAGIMFNQTQPLDFYEAKAMLNKLFVLLDCSMEWKQVGQVPFPWFVPFQTASLYYEGAEKGIAGMIDPLFLKHICPGGSAFIFELNGDFLLQVKAKQQQFKPLPKYPVVSRDLSMLVPLSLTVDKLQESIKRVASNIVKIELIDFFEKAGWEDHRSVTFRLIIRDDRKTLTKEEIDLLWDKVKTVVTKEGATVR